MNARPGWSPSDYDRWLDRGLDDPEPDDEPTALQRHFQRMEAARWAAIDDQGAWQ